MRLWRALTALSSLARKGVAVVMGNPPRATVIGTTRTQVKSRPARGLRGELTPRDHAGARAPGDGRHVGEHVRGPGGEGEDEDPREQLRGTAGARRLHALERTLAQQGGVIAPLEELEEPEVELLVHPEVARPAGLV